MATEFKPSKDPKVHVPIESITVFDVKKESINLETVDENRLYFVLIDIVRELPVDMKNQIMELKNLSSLLKKFPTNYAQYRDTMIEIVLREILRDWGIIPIVENATTPYTVQVQVPIRKLAQHADGHWINLSIEDVIHVSGIKIIHSKLGKQLLDDFSFDTMTREIVNKPFTLLQSGNFQTPALTIYAKKIIEQSLPFNVDKILFGPDQPAAVSIYNIIAKLYALNSYYVSGAANQILFQKFNNYLYGKNMSLRTMTVQKAQSSSLPLLIPDHIKFFVERLSELTGLIASNDNEYMSHMNYVCDFDRLGANSAYYYLVAEGKNSKFVESYFAQLKLRGIENDAHARITCLRQNEIVRLGNYQKIILEKLGQRVYEKIKNIKSLSFLMRNLTDREGEIVKTEYRGRRERWLQQVRNKCPHMDRLMKFRSATSIIDSMNELSRLREFFKSPTDSDWIHCKQCGFKIICPHMNENIEYQYNDLPFGTIQTKLYKYVIKYQKKESGNEDFLMYYCKICGESLSEQAENIVGTQETALDDTYTNETKKLIWHEALVVLNSVFFPVPIDKKRFAAMISEECFPLVGLYDYKVGGRKFRPKSKTADSDDIEPRIHVFVILFVYAYILRLIETGNDVRMLDVSPGSKISVYIGSILKHINKHYSSVIHRADTTRETISVYFGEIYKILTEKGGIQKLVYANPIKTLINETVGIDPVYHYGVIIAKLTKKIPIPKSTDTAAAQREFEIVFGAQIEPFIKELRKGKISLYQNLINLDNVVSDGVFADYRALGKTCRKNFVLNHCGGADNVSKSRTMSQVSVTDMSVYELQKAWFIRSYQFFRDYIHNPDNFAGELSESYEKQSSDMITIEKGIAYNMYFNRIYNYGTMKMTANQTFTFQKKSIAELYDERGVGHIWNGYVYEKGGDRIIMKRSDINDAYSKQYKCPTLGYKLVDYQCSTCGVLRSNIDKLDANKVMSSLLHITKFMSFFEFYRSRCPRGDLHVFQKSVCTKCNGDELFMLTPTTKEHFENAKTYYAKYFEHFRDEMITSQRTEEIVSRTIRIDSAIHDEFAKKWEYVANIIEQVSTLTGCKINALYNIGLYEGHEYSTIIDEKIQDDLTDNFDAKLFTTSGAYIYAASQFNTIRNFHKMSKKDKDFSDYDTLIKSMKISPSDYSTLLTIFPLSENMRNHFMRRVAISKIRSPLDQRLFIVSEICAMLVEIGKAHKNGAKISTFIVNRLLSKEKMLCKYEHVDLTLFGVDEDGSINVGTDSDFVADDIGDVGEDIQNTPVDEDAVGFNGMDYSGENEDADADAS